MNTSNAQRQRVYRKRHLKSQGGEHSTLERINTLVCWRTKLTLKRLSDCYGVTQRVILERILDDAQKRLLATLDYEQQDLFNDGKLSLRSNGCAGERGDQLTAIPETE